MGQAVRLFAKKHEDARKIKQDISICDDSPSDTQTAEADVTGLGIGGILEGFGLLSFKEEGICPGEDDGQTAKDVPLGKPSLGNDIAGKQTNQRQNILSLDQITQQKKLDGTVTPNQADLGSMPVKAHEGSAEPPLKDGFFQGLKSALENVEAKQDGLVQNTGAVPVKQADAALLRKSEELTHIADVPATAMLSENNGASRNDGFLDAKPQNREQEQSITQTQPNTASFVPETLDKPVSFASTAQAAQTQSAQQPGESQPSQSDMAHNILNIVERIKSQTKQDTSEMSVTLRPEFLGKLSIKLVMGENGLKAEIKAESSAVKEAIGSQMSMLHDSLREKGIQVEHLEVIYEAPAFVQQQQHDGRNQGQSAHKNNLRILSTQPMGQAESICVMCESDLAIKNSSIEFQA